MGYWLPNLEELYLIKNKLSGTIPSSISNASKLTIINMSMNSFTRSIPNTLGSLRPLRKLFLHTNSLTRESSTPELRIFSSLTNCRQLEVLRISLNPLNSILPISSFGNLSTKLQVFDAFGCKIKGKIPSGIGIVPSTIEGAQSLVSLSLFDNEMQGPILQSLGNLTSLELLDLSRNNLSGKIPESLEELRYLQYLNVSFNRLQGEIPSGGHFANFTAWSFMHNDALCGEPRLQVSSCKTNKNGRLTPKITKADLSPLAWRKFLYQELLRATEALSETNLVAKGSYGSVYKGMLSDGMNIVVKVFNLQLEGAFKSFDVECEVLRDIQHRNLVKIISSCCNMDFKALVLEYMPNGSLENWLHSHNYYLDIVQRLNIMIDVASALKHLHHGHTTPIIHCDLKPSNVLLDEDMTAYVADFGIAKLLSDGDLMVQTMTLATIGYLAPSDNTELKEEYQQDAMPIVRV
ncbi:probable LRR receptor-like serine/threonine-protein kinase At3g47570 [Cornus florida]|uniref:probable LRR receptor-like serine/threonine-protein kinase At3g47570 n=1 Tax=Cornus florida TaxID=4283 RepID=UPI002899942F|nr:probable LRR receptor-like serine/threonine-protein kinase At3g47570 [Cornus florida]